MELNEYRKEARRIALLRDSQMCMMCKWVHNQRTKAVEVHHVFGRGAMVGSVKEETTSLMCVCRDCHPQPIMLYSEHAWKEDVIHAWVRMNLYPENSDYILIHGKEVLNPIGLGTFKIGYHSPPDWRKQE